MMTVAITAIFPTLAEAQGAASCMAICPDRGSLQLSVEHCDTAAMGATGRMLHGGRIVDNLLDMTPTSQAGIARGSSAILRVRCSEQLADFVTRELAALGAEKITLVSPS